MANKQAVEQLKQSLDKITQAKNNPEQIQQMVADAKRQLDQLAQSDQSSEHQSGQQSSQHSGQR